MLRYVYGRDEIVRPFVASLIPACRERGLPKASVSIGVIDPRGRLIAGIVYHNYDPDAGTIEMSLASISARWLSRETVRRMYKYPFLELGCQMVYARVRADDERLLRQIASLNYSLIKVPRMFGRDVDAVLCLLTREAWEDNKFNRRFGYHLMTETLDEEAA